MNRNPFTYLFLLLCFIGIQHLDAQTVLMNHFNLTNEGADIMLDWEVQSENGIVEYRIFRKFDDDPDFEYVDTVLPNGNRQYQYLDDGIFKTNTGVIHYKLQVVLPNNRIEPFTRQISHNPTSIQVTWGSIKAMFRE